MKSSTFSTVNRRDFLKHIALASASTLLLVACNTTGDVKTGPIYLAIVVDVEPVRAKNIDGYADKIAFYQKQAMAEQYAGNVVAGNKSLPALTVEIHSIYFGDTGGMDFDSTTPNMMHSSFRTSDTLEGVAVIRSGGKEIRRQKILAVHLSNDHSAWSMAGDEKRLDELTRFFAYRLRQELGD
jgi:hypothetical protein